MNIEELYPEIKEAHVYIKHRNYASALEIYVGILEESNQDSEEYSHVLLEYSKCLLECIMYQSEMNYRKILQTRNPIEEDVIEEDLETCWDCLETCRVRFEDIEERSKLAEVHKGLGDIQCLKNSFEEGKEEYLKAIDCCDDELLQAEIFECIADCCRNMKMDDDAIYHYKQIVSIYEKLGMEEQVNDYKSLIEGMIFLKENRIDDGNIPVKESDSEPVNINHLKRQ
ncbi:hypothetical protein GINT2_000543 [Glugoides intestinalis]